MDSKRKISYQWKLFMPLILGMWIAIAVLGIWIFKFNYDYKVNQAYSQLRLVNQQILGFYNSNETESTMRFFLDFVYDYYRDSPEFDKIRITVYKDNRLLYAYGPPTQLSTERLAEDSGLTSSRDASSSVDVARESADHGDYFFYNASTSSDGKLVVVTVLPIDTDIMTAVKPNLKVFVVLFLVAVFLTGVAYLGSRHFGRNIRLLRSVAEKAATDPNFIPAVNFPHDELGDINRQIVHIFNERAQAMKRQKREHAVALHAIEEKALAKRQMSNNINHELRTPISVIKGYLDTIIDNPNMDEKTRHNFIVKSQEHANRLVALITDVSAISRLEEGAERISTEELNMHDLTFTLASDIEDSGVIAPMEFKFDIPLDCIIMGNYNLLTGMLMNLARNAAAYSKGTVCELIYTGEDENFFSFVFRDNGVGVGEQHIPHLFERFYRVDSGRARKAGGTGLGLPIVHSTILAHGGTITVENRKTGGLAFRFSLPKPPKGK